MICSGSWMIWKSAWRILILIDQFIRSAGANVLLLDGQGDPVELPGTLGELDPAFSLPPEMVLLQCAVLLTGLTLLFGQPGKRRG